MLTICKECHGQVSDKALICPHCGIPMKGRITMSKRTKVRLPNGFGSITKLNRPLRKPYLARVTNAKDDQGRCILKSLGYYKTYNDAYSALVEYNKDPYDLDKLPTVSDVYKAYKKDVFNAENHSKGYTRAVERAFEQSEKLHNMAIRSVRPRHIKLCLDAIPTAHAKANLKNFWNRLFDYALANELVDRNYGREFSLDPKTSKEVQKYKRTHLTFSDTEMRALWKNAENEVIKLILIQCYSGWRPAELCELKVSEVDLELCYMKGGCKTEAGTGRVVPIHSAVCPLVESLYKDAIKAGRDTLTDLSYQQYYYLFKKTMNHFGMDEGHRPHDPRKQFITMALKAGADPMSVKLMAGHKITDITEKSYTDRDVEWLRQDLEKIDASVYK